MFGEKWLEWKASWPIRIGLIWGKDKVMWWKDWLIKWCCNTQLTSSKSIGWKELFRPQQWGIWKWPALDHLDCCSQGSFSKCTRDLSAVPGVGAAPLMLKWLGLGAIIIRGSQKHGNAFGYQSELECKLAAGPQDPNGSQGSRAGVQCKWAARMTWGQMPSVTLRKILKWPRNSHNYPWTRSPRQVLMMTTCLTDYLLKRIK